MLVLGIETATPSGSVALCDDHRLLGVQTIWANRQHSRQILPAIELLLFSQGLRPEDLDVVGVSIGPGSFTGLRVGVTIAKALCLGEKTRLVSVPTLEALAHQAHRGSGYDFVLPLLDARKGEVYGQYYRLTKNGLAVHGDTFALAPELIAHAWPGRVLVAGEGAIRYAPVLSKGITLRFGTDQVDKLIFAAPDCSLASATSICVLARRRAEDGDFKDAADSNPLYVRDSGARLPQKPKAAD